MKKVCVISCPIATRSGYGARSRDFVKSLIDLKGQEWDIKILPQRWGETSWGFCKDHPEWSFLYNYLAKPDREIKYLSRYTMFLPLVKLLPF